MRHTVYVFFFFFNDTATTEIYTLSLHDALPILLGGGPCRPSVGALLPLPARGAPAAVGVRVDVGSDARARVPGEDRKSTRLNSSHGYISYAVFCLKKKKHRCARG